MRKSYQFRIYPNKNQEVKLNSALSTCRHLYNDSLSERKRQAELNNLYRSFDVFPWGKPEWINYYDQQNALPDNKNQYQKELHSHVLQNVLRRVDIAFKNFFRGNGYPRFQGRNRYNSFTYPEFSVDIDKQMPTVEVKTSTGIDVGLSSLLTLSNGEQIKPPEFLRASEKKLTREQIKLSKKKRGSNNRRKQRTEVAKVHRKTRDQRKDFAHKTSRILVDTYDKIVLEDLQIKNMMRKAEYAGKTVELVNRKGTSQVCICGCS